MWAPYREHFDAAADANASKILCAARTCVEVAAQRVTVRLARAPGTHKDTNGVLCGKAALRRGGISFR